MPEKNILTEEELQDKDIGGDGEEKDLEENGEEKEKEGVDQAPSSDKEDPFFDDEPVFAETKPEVPKPKPKKEEKLSRVDFRKKDEKKDTPKSIVPNLEFEWPNAPAGEANISVVFKEGLTTYEFLNLKLVNRIYAIPSDMEPRKVELLIRALKANGFRDVTEIESVIPSKIDGKLVYVAMHPEHTRSSPKNGNIGLTLCSDEGKPLFITEGKNKGQPITKTVSMQNGLVITEDKLVYQALVKSGFVDGGSKEKEKGEDEWLVQ